MKRLFPFLFISLLILTLNGCAIAGGIFKAGVWVGVLVVILVIALVIFLATRGSKK